MAKALCPRAHRKSFQGFRTYNLADFAFFMPVCRRTITIGARRRV